VIVTCDLISPLMFVCEGQIIPLKQTLHVIS
jgi:hypothetical protein